MVMELPTDRTQVNSPIGMPAGLIDELCPKLAEVSDTIHSTHRDLVTGGDASVVIVFAKVVNGSDLRVPLFVEPLLDAKSSTWQTEWSELIDELCLGEGPLGPTLRDFRILIAVGLAVDALSNVIDLGGFDLFNERSSGQLRVAV